MAKHYGVQTPLKPVDTYGLNTPQHGDRRQPIYECPSCKKRRAAGRDDPDFKCCGTRYPVTGWHPDP